MRGAPLGQFSTTLTTAGFPVPSTVRDLSELYLTWGLARREETPAGTRWSTPAVLPLPGDLLPLDPELTQHLDGIRGTRGRADAERLEAHRRFCLVMDGEHFHENRIQVSRGWLRPRTPPWGPPHHCPRAGDGAEPKTALPRHCVAATDTGGPR